jgi:hypothetical protein
MNNNPVKFNDPSGHFIDTIFDIGSIIYDIYDIATNGLSVENGVSLVADIGSLVIPGVTGGGVAVRAITHADDVADAVKAVNAAANASQAVNQAGNIAQAASQADNIADGTQTYRAVTDGYPFNWKPTRADINGTPPGLSCSIGCDGMAHQDIFEMSVGRPAGPGDRLYQVDTTTLQSSQFGLTPAPILPGNPYHAVTGGSFVNQWTNATKREFQAMWKEIWSYEP